ncbi:MAG: hypothetical protein HOP04_14355 [Methylophilaceae bacterium]|nr:hypothetical protein [Methylophilaceae bacterium]
MKLHPYIFTAIAAMASLNATQTHAATINNACPAQVLVKSSTSSAITVDSELAARKLAPEFFGFNLNWVLFQRSLWNPNTHQVPAEVVGWLKAFPGAVYRYDGGGGNAWDWQDFIGDPATRPTLSFVDWLTPFKATFGPDEYLSFVKNVNGQAWYVVNIYGDTQGELQPEKMAVQAGQLSNYLATKQQEGLPNILRWELGNELDRGSTRWLPEKLAATSKLAASEIKRYEPQAKFVSLMEEYSPQADIGITASQYNRRLATGLGVQVDENALHLYYDGLPGGRPLTSQVGAICSAIADAKTVSPNRTPAFWITEHARVSPNAFVDPNWTAAWARTADLEAALGVADMIIAAAQIPEVKGAFLHALHGGNLPWPLFHKNSFGGGMHPSVVYWALRIMRDSMLEQVLPTTTSSPNNSKYLGGYDVRTMVLTDATHSKYAIWAVNRSAQALATRLTIPALKNLKVVANHTRLTDKNVKANNIMVTNRVPPIKTVLALTFDTAGATAVTLPPYSISAISLAKP